MSSRKKDIGAMIHTRGASFRVWAPFAQSVAVTGTFNKWSPTPMASDGDGYWSTTVHRAEAGQEYKYLITYDGKQFLKNDPRSRALTTSAGNSVLLDTTFDWQGDDFTPPPQNQQVVYELHVGTFNRPDSSTSGTFDTAAAKLDYLCQLGINMIELMPICAMSQDRGWGYAPDYLFAIESLYGGWHQFLNFVKEAHRRGIGIIVDVVYNHFGPDEKLDLWRFDGWYQDGGGGIYFYNDWRRATPWGDTRPDFGRPEVRQFITDNVRMLLQDCHADGLRLDSTIFMRNVQGFNNNPDNDIPEAWTMLQRVNNVARKIKPSALMIAEDAGNDYLTKVKNDGGAGFNAQWQLDFPHRLREVLNIRDDAYCSLTDLVTVLSAKFNGDAFQRIVYSDSHDSASNGAKRLNEEVSPGQPGALFARRRALQAAVMTLTAPGIPMLLQGQEFMAGGDFNDWQALDWTNANQFSGITQAYRHLIDLRKNVHGHTAGLMGHGIDIAHLNEEQKMLAYHRWDKGGPADDVMVVLNLSRKAKRGYVINFPHDGLWRVRFNSDWSGYSPDFKNTASADVRVEGRAGALDIGPYSALILSRDPVTD